MPTSARPHRRRRTVLRGSGALLALLISSWTHAAVPTARAQTEPAVSLELRSQTAWVEPVDERFNLRVLAHNEGSEPIGDLSVRFGVGPVFTSRSSYEDSLTTGPRTIEDSQRVTFGGTIEPRGSREFALKIDPSSIDALDPLDSGVYPVRVEVRSGSTPVGALYTSLIWIVRDPVSPVSFSWWTEFDAPLPLDPAGRLADPAFEGAIADGGTLAEQAEALAELAARKPPVPIDLVVRPALLEQLVRMTDGYERTSGLAPVEPETGGASDAAEILRILREVAAADRVQISAMPFAGPSVPALLAGSLQADLETQRQWGNAWTNEAIGVSPGVAVARPPGGELSDEALAWYAETGARTILADVDTVDRPLPEQELTAPSTATVTTERGDVTLVLPDPGTQALLERPDLLADPVRASQAVLAELAVIWREEPVPEPPEQRGLALHLPSDLPPTMWQPLMGRLASAPFLNRALGQGHVADVVPPGAGAVLRDPSDDVFSAEYAGAERGLRRDVADLDSMLEGASVQPERLQRNLLVAEGLAYLGDEVAGQAWLESVADVTTQVFSSVTPQPQVFTLTSREGEIPLLMGDPGPVELHVTVKLESPAGRLQFPNGNEREVVLEPGGNQLVTFSVLTTTAGRHPIEVSVLAPSGHVVAVQDNVYVRSTALSAIALGVTGAAALVLMLLWVRRLVRRGRTA